MTEPIEQLAARVAGLMGWQCWHSYKKPPEPPVWKCGERESDMPPKLYEPAEVFRLMCEFNVWPVCTPSYCLVLGFHGSVRVSHDNTPESRQQAAARAVLMSVEQILKEKHA